jgi:hypothetical protein
VGKANGSVKLATHPHVVPTKRMVNGEHNGNFAFYRTPCYAYVWSVVKLVRMSVQRFVPFAALRKAGRSRPVLSLLVFYGHENGVWCCEN